MLQLSRENAIESIGSNLLMLLSTVNAFGRSRNFQTVLIYPAQFLNDTESQQASESQQRWLLTFARSASSQFLVIHRTLTVPLKASL
ncbi:hypothetical protein DFO48_101789 [Comamonas sp. AG1104]|nr:hypothetical protein DFO48_101789 [Comamonas sp. AG1104]